MTLWHLFWAFLVSNILGYGGGPSTIPLYQTDIVNTYHWMTNREFGDLLAIANALPGPISTKIGGYVGYVQGGLLGSVLALISTIAPSAIAVIVLVKFSEKFKDAPQLKALSRSVTPVIAVMMAVLVWQFMDDASKSVGWLQSCLIAVISLLLLQKFKVHPALVIVASLLYGGFVLG